MLYLFRAVFTLNLRLMLCLLIRKLITNYINIVTCTKDKHSFTADFHAVIALNTQVAIQLKGHIVVWPTDATSVYVSTLDFQYSYEWYVNKHSADEEYKM